MGGGEGGAEVERLAVFILEEMLLFMDVIKSFLKMSQSL